MKLKKYPLRLKSKVIGFIQGRTFFKTISAKKHLLRCPQAICLQVSSVKEAMALKALWVKIRIKETNETFCSSIANLEKRGTLLDRGHGVQVMLELRYWKKQ